MAQSKKVWFQLIPQEGDLFGQNEWQIYALAREVKRVGAERGIKVPKKLRLGGGSVTSPVWIAAKSQEVLDLAVELAPENRLEYLPDWVYVPGWE